MEDPHGGEDLNSHCPWEKGGAPGQLHPSWHVSRPPKMVVAATNWSRAARLKTAATTARMIAVASALQRVPPCHSHRSGGTRAVV